MWYVGRDARRRTVQQTLTSAQTRQKMKEAYAAEFAAVIERAEKQIILAKHGRRLLTLLDDNPITPGDVRQGYDGAGAARQVLNDAEDDLRKWEPELDTEPVVRPAEAGEHLDDNNLDSSVATGGHLGAGDGTYMTPAVAQREDGAARPQAPTAQSIAAA